MRRWEAPTLTDSGSILYCRRCAEFTLMAEIRNSYRTKSHCGVNYLCHQCWKWTKEPGLGQSIMSMDMSIR